MAGQTENKPLIVDMVCDVCRIEGFQVDQETEENGDPSLVSILATKKDGADTRQVAFECSQADRQVNGREVEAFQSRLRALGVKNGVYVSPKGFTGDAEYIARKLGIELWDLVRLKERFEKITVKEKTRVEDTLPVSRSLPERILYSHMENGRVLKPMGWPRLEFRPYYFAEFSLLGKRRPVAAGVLVFDGVDGRVCDATVFHGELNGLATTGFFIDCLELQPSPGSLPELPEEIEMKDTVAVAAVGVTEEAIGKKVAEVLKEDANVDPDNVKVSKVDMLHVPIVTVELGGGKVVYKKIVQAATGRIIWDESAKCSFCDQSSQAVCEICLRTTCSDHKRICNSCKKRLCEECAIVRGHLNKTVICPTCNE